MICAIGFAYRVAGGKSMKKYGGSSVLSTPLSRYDGYWVV